MNGNEFAAWLKVVKAKGIAKTQADAAFLLGVHFNVITAMKTRGTDRRTALACAALLEGLLPYPENEKSARDR